MTDRIDSRCGAGVSPGAGGRRLLTILAAVAVLVTAGCAATPTAKPAAAEPSYGSLPSYLPSGAGQPDSVLTGTVDRPAITSQGDSVNVQLATGSVLVTVTGPEVPGEGLPYQTPTTTCTWTITMTAATTAIPITVGDFTALDHLGSVYRPALVPGQPKPPATVAPGQTVTFELRAVMTVGEGLMRWAPGQKILASWDFEVEND